MSSEARDFSGNEMLWLEKEDDYETKLGLIDDYIGEVEDKKDYHEGEASAWDNVLDELQKLRDSTENLIDSLKDEEEEGCRNCDDPVFADGLCGDCHRMEASKQPEEGTLPYFMQYRGRE